MSDDGYYAGSPDDDFEDLLWDADPTPDLADDLAEHAAYSPVWQDDPIGELEPYHSDWEYYSDDYYDDDPAILRRIPIDGNSPPQSQTSVKPSSQKRGRKRKLNEAREVFATEEQASLSKCIQGTVWARGDEDRVAFYQQGQQEKVALLTNWRELFRSGKDNTNSSRNGGTNRDEAWANDLGLADMGLFRGQAESLLRAEGSLEDNVGASNDEVDVEDDSAIEAEKDVEDYTTRATSIPKSVQKRRHIADEIDTPTYQHEDGGGVSSRKKRRTAGLPSPPTSSESNGMPQMPTDSGEMEFVSNPDDALASHQTGDTNFANNVARRLESNGQNPKSADRKRKRVQGNVDFNGDDHMLGQHQAKKIASNKTTLESESTKEALPRPRRSTRNRNK